MKISSHSLPSPVIDLYLPTACYLQAYIAVSTSAITERSRLCVLSEHVGLKLPYNTFIHNYQAFKMILQHLPCSKKPLPLVYQNDLRSYLLPSLNNTYKHVLIAPSPLPYTVNQSMRLENFSISSLEFSVVV